jgi:predicted Zn-dependent protease
MRLRLIFALALLVGLTGCETSPTGRQQLILVSEGQISEMGVTAFQEMRAQTPQTNDPAVRNYVNCITNAIIEQLPADARRMQWEVAVFEDDSPNAFALPGGKMGVHTGMVKLAENQDQLAAVIGHEIAHVLARHHAERISQQFATQTGVQLVSAMAGPQTATKQQLMGLLGLGAQVGILLPYSREQEREADVYGLDLMAKAGFDPRASVGLWQNMSAAAGQRAPEFLSTHPAPASRINDLQARIPQVMPLFRQAIIEGRLPDCSL